MRRRRCSLDYFFFFSSRRRHTRLQGDWSSDVCSSDLLMAMRRSLGEQMNSHYAGWRNKQAGTHTVPNGAKNVNGTSCKRRTRPVGIYSGSGCGIVPIRTREDAMSGPVKVQIFGQTYSIQGELDGKYVQKLAKYVDEKMRSEEHTSELQSPCNLVCRLLLEKKKHSRRGKRTTCIDS